MSSLAGLICFLTACCTFFCMSLTIADYTSPLLQVLHEFCSFVLKSKPTSVKADEAEISKLETLKPTTQTEQRRLLAIQYRFGKKKILQSCIRKHQKLAKLFSRS